MVSVYADAGLLRQEPGAYWSVGVEDDGGFRVIHRQTRDPRCRKSMEAEASALADALHFVESLPPTQSVTLYSDCRGLVRSLQTKKPIRRSRAFQELLSLWTRLLSLGRSLRIAWVPRGEMQMRFGH